MQSVPEHVVIIGAGGAIGGALVDHYVAQPGVKRIFAFSREGKPFASEMVQSFKLDYYDEAAMADAAAHLDEVGGVDLMVVTTGVLHTEDIMPEKALHDLTAHKFETLFRIDTIVPALITKHFIGHLRVDREAVFAILSARVGSVSDNHLGGWYAYRCAKAALNMFIKNTSIELARKHKHQCIVGIHPGTVDSPLSKPFQAHLDPKKIFSPALAAQYVQKVISDAKPQDSGKVLAWDGKEISP